MSNSVSEKPRRRSVYLLTDIQDEKLTKASELTGVPKRRIVTKAIVAESERLLKSGGNNG